MRQIEIMPVDFESSAVSPGFSGGHCSRASSEEGVKNGVSNEAEHLYEALS